MRGWVLALVVAAGCGPVAYINQVTRHADDAVERARAAQADKFAPYWWTRAVEYLHMARDVAGHADYQGANRFGRLAEEAATKAAEQAQDPKLRWTDPLADEHGAPEKAAPEKTAPAKAAPEKAAPAKAAPEKGTP